MDPSGLVVCGSFGGFNLFISRSCLFVDLHVWLMTLISFLSHLIDTIDVDGFAGDQLAGVDRQSGSCQIRRWA